LSLLILVGVQGYLALEILPEFNVPNDTSDIGSVTNSDPGAIHSSAYKGYWNAINGKALATDTLIIDAVELCLLTVLLIKECRNVTKK
jgi:hypothetical protein